MPTIQLPVSGAGTSSQWTPDGGATTAECVRAAGDGKTATTDAFGQLDLHELEDLPATAASVDWFKTRLIVFDTGSAPTSWRPAIRLGATTLYGDALQATAVPTAYEFSWARPGGGAWTVADVNAVKAGYESVLTVPIPETGEPRIGDCRGVCSYQDPRLPPMIVHGTAVIPALARSSSAVVDRSSSGAASIDRDNSGAAGMIVSIAWMPCVVAVNSSMALCLSASAST